MYHHKQHASTSLAGPYGTWPSKHVVACVDIFSRVVSRLVAIACWVVRMWWRWGSGVLQGNMGKQQLSRATAPTAHGAAGPGSSNIKLGLWCTWHAATSMPPCWQEALTFLGGSQRCSGCVAAHAAATSAAAASAWALVHTASSYKHATLLAGSTDVSGWQSALQRLCCSACSGNICSSSFGLGSDAHTHTASSYRHATVFDSKH
jgi:hypothetical protein